MFCCGALTASSNGNEGCNCGIPLPRACPTSGNIWPTARTACGRSPRLGLGPRPGRQRRGGPLDHASIENASRQAGAIRCHASRSAELQPFLRREDEGEDEGTVEPGHEHEAPGAQLRTAGATSRLRLSWGQAAAESEARGQGGEQVLGSDEDEDEDGDGDGDEGEEDAAAAAAGGDGDGVFAGGLPLSARRRAAAASSRARMAWRHCAGCTSARLAARTETLRSRLVPARSSCTT